MVVSRIFVVGLALMLATAAAAQTPGPDLPPVDPPGHWRQMTLDDATSDSKCVGRFDTPLCTVETMIACFARRHRKLCNEAILRPGFFDEERLDRSPKFTRMQYRTERSEVLTQEGIGEIPRAADRERPGDLRVDVQNRECYMVRDKEICGLDMSEPNIFTLRKIEARWVVLDWSIPDIRWEKRK